MTKQHFCYLSLLLVFMFILSGGMLLFSEFINIVSTLFYNFIEFIMLMYTFLVISLQKMKRIYTLYKEHIVWRISFSKFSDVLPAFTCARVISSLWSICLGVNILRGVRSQTLATWAKSKGHTCPCFCFPIGDISCFQSR